MPEDKIDKVSNAQAAAWHGREGIRANCIAPGHLHSAFTEHLKPEHRERRKQVVPLGTEGTPWDVAMAAVFLASDKSRNNKLVAIKRMNMGINDQGIHAEVLREISFLKRFKGKPYILNLEEVIIFNRRVHMVSEYIKGECHFHK